MAGGFALSVRLDDAFLPQIWFRTTGRNFFLGFSSGRTHPEYTNYARFAFRLVTRLSNFRGARCDIIYRDQAAFRSPSALPTQVTANGGARGMNHLATSVSGKPGHRIRASFLLESTSSSRPASAQRGENIPCAAQPRHMARIWGSHFRICPTIQILREQKLWSLANQGSNNRPAALRATCRYMRTVSRAQRLGDPRRPIGERFSQNRTAAESLAPGWRPMQKDRPVFRLASPPGGHAFSLGEGGP